MSRVLVRALVVSCFGIVAAACGDDGGGRTDDPPDTSLTTTPAALSTARLARFEFTGTGTITEFKCSVDGSGESRCVSPLEIEVGDGDHTFAVTAYNGLIGDESPATFAWRVDATAPNTEITSGPPAFDNSTSVEIAFTGTPTTDIERFECSLDDAPFVTCTSPAPFTNLVSGVHTVRVRAVDAAGNADSSPAQRSWTLDTSTPDTTITSGPEQDSTSGGNVEFAFSSPDATATFECKFDSGTYVSCSSPAAYNALRTGSHTFEVRAKNPNSGAVDPTPAIRTWMVDGSAPVVTIDTTPTNPSNDPTPSFTFSSPSTDITGFECQIDGVTTFAPCTSPYDASALVDGSYVFRVRVTDSVGNIGTAMYAWSIDLSAPTVSIIGGPSGATPSNTAVFTFQTSGSPTSIRCRLDAGALAVCVSPTTYNNLPDGPHTFTVTVADEAGNSSSAMRMFEVITQGPTVEITGGPLDGASIGDATPTFTFVSTNATETSCRFDGGSYEPCSSPYTTQLLANGLHTFEVRVRDAALNSASATRSFTVDTTPPTVMITAGPTGPTNDTTPTFSFLTGGMPSQTQCRYDANAFVNCTSPFTSVTPLSAGAHRFEVRVTDLAGNSSTDSRDFSVVTNGPTVTITSGPSGPTGDNTPTFAFTTTNSPTEIDCQIDALAFAPCVSPFTPSSLSDGLHSFTVRVSDAAGNTDSDSRTFTVDTEFPMVTITGGPTGPTNDTTPTFTFISNAQTIECRIGANNFAACNASFTPPPLPEGSYRFEVRGSDDAGNSTTAGRDFSIDTTAPTVAINARAGTLDDVTNPNQSENINDPTPLFTFTATSFVTLECAMNSGFVSCASGSFQVTDDLGGTPAGAGSGFLPDDHRFTVRATDAAGNVATVVRNFDVNSLAPPNATLLSGPTTTCPADDVTPCNAVSAVGSITNHGGQTVSTVRRVPSFTFAVPAGNWTQVACRFNTQAFADCTPSGASVATTITYAGAALLPQGANNLTIRVCNASFQCTTNVFPFTVDTLAPTVAYATGPSGSCPDGPDDPEDVTCDPTNRPTPTFTYTASADAALLRCRIAAGASPSGAFEACDSATTHVFDGSPLMDNLRYSFGVRVYDAAYNQADSARNNFLVDLIPPDIAVTGPNAPPVAYKAANLPAFVFSTTMERNPQSFQCQFTNNAGTVGAWTTCTSPFAPATAEGTYAVRIRMTDTAGNRTTVPPEASPAMQYRIDDTAPGITITPVAASFTDGATGKLTRNNKPRFTVRITNPSPGGVTPSDIVTASTVCTFVNDDGAVPTGCTVVSGDFYAAGGAVVEPSTNLVDPAPRSMLNWEIRVHAEDRAANETDVAFDFTADLTPPVLVLGALTPASPTRTTPTLAFTLSDERTGIVRECGHDTDATVPVSGCAVATSFTTTTLATNGSADGTHYYRIRGTDAAGNQVDNVSSFTFDSTAPGVVLNDSAAVPGPGETDPSSSRTPSFPYTVTNAPPGNALAGAVASPLQSVTCSFARVTGTGGVPTCRSQPSTSLPTTTTPVTVNVQIDPAGSVTQFTDGTYTVTVTAVDGANVGGNSFTTATHGFRVDGTPPVFGTINGPATGDELNSTNNTPVWTLTSVTDDRPFTVTCTLTGTLAGGGSYTNTQTCAADSAGGSPYSTSNTTYTPPAALAPGSYSLAISASDGLNTPVSPAGFPRTFTVEADAPVVTAMSSVADGAELISSNNSVTLTVTSSSDASSYSVECRITGTLAGGGTYGPFTQPCGGDSTAPSPFADTASYTFTRSSLAPGSYTVTVVGTDTLGNTSAATGFPKSFTVENDPPVIGAITGAPADNAVLTFATRSFTAAIATSTDASAFSVRCQLTGVLTGGGTFDKDELCIDDPTAPGSGSGSFMSGNLARGTYTFAITATDALGNSVVATGFPRTYIVESTAPTVTTPLAYTGPSVISGTTLPPFSVNVSDASGGDVDCTLTPGGTTFSNVVTFTATAVAQTFTIPNPGTSGAYSLACTATDNLGTAVSVGSASFTVDASAPVVSGFAPVGFVNGATINDNTPTFQITTTDASAHTVDCTATPSGTFNDVLTLAAGTNTNQQFTLPTLADGMYTLSCAAVDAFGQSTTASNTITFTIGPATTINVVAAFEGLTVGSADLPLSIDVTTNAVTDVVVSCVMSGANSATQTLPSRAAGTYMDTFTFTSAVVTASGATTITCTANPSMGPSVNDAVSFTVDVTPPSITGLNCPNSMTGDVTCTYTVTGHVSGTTTCDLELDDGSPVSLGEACGATSKAYTGLSPESYVFTISAVDAAGNTATATDTFTVTSPVVAIYGPKDGAILNTTPAYAFEVSGSPDARVRCELDGARVDCAYAYPRGLIRVTEPSQGSHVVRVTVTEPATKSRAKATSTRATLVAGKSQSASRSFTFDTIAPEVTLTAAPRALMNADTATVTFATKGASSTLCRFDSKPAVKCTEQYLAEQLAAGPHTIAVVAFDEAGNVGKAEASFTTDPVAVCLDGGSDHGVATVPALTTLGGSTVEMWFRAWTETTAMDLVSLDDPNTSGRELAVSFEADAFVLTTASGRVTVPVAIELATWHHFAFEVGADSVTVFVDGVARGTVRAPGVGRIALGAQPTLYLGFDAGAGAAPGAFADVRVSTGAVYGKGAKPAYPAAALDATVHLFPADEGADLESVDLMGAGSLVWSPATTWSTCEADPRVRSVSPPIGMPSGSDAAMATGMAP